MVCTYHRLPCPPIGPRPFVPSVQSTIVSTLTKKKLLGKYARLGCLLYFQETHPESIITSPREKCNCFNFPSKRSSEEYARGIGKSSEIFYAMCMYREAFCYSGAKLKNCYILLLLLVLVPATYCISCIRSVSTYKPHFVNYMYILVLIKIPISVLGLRKN